MKIKHLLKGYTRSQFFNDVMAGIIVGIVALPLAISFGIASGVSPVVGIFTTIISGFIIAVLSGSRVQIGGPTAATIVIIYSIMRQFGPSGLVMATLMAGLMLLVMGLLRMGRVIRLIPDPLIEGFTAGIAIDLFISQIKDFSGLKMGALPASFLDKCLAYVSLISAPNYYAIGLGILTIIINQAAPFFITRKLPGPILAITSATILAFILRLPVDTIGSRFGQTTISLPMPIIPHFDRDMMVQLLRPAFTIAILVGIMSLISGVVAERNNRKAFKSNKELIAEGIANLFSSIFGGIPVTGSIARTMTNVENGGKTRVAGIVQSVTLFLLIFLVGRWISYIPVAAVAGLLMVVAYNMSKWRTFSAIIVSGSGDAILMLITFFATLFIDLTIALELGLVFAAFQFMHRMTLVSHVKELTNSFLANNGMYIEEHIVKYDIPNKVAVYEITGPLFFAVAHKFKESFNEITVKPKIVIIRMRNVPIADSTGIRTLLLVAQVLNEQHIEFVIAEYRYDRVDEKLSHMLIAKIGKENIQGTLNEAVIRCREILAAKATLN